MLNEALLLLEEFDPRVVDRKGLDLVASQITIDDEMIDDRYENVTICEKLGSGAYAGVTKVRLNSTGKLMAMKCIQISGHKDLYNENQQLNEIKNLARTNQETSQQYKIAFCSECADKLPKFHGAIYANQRLSIFMELMHCTLYEFYCRIFKHSNDKHVFLRATDPMFYDETREITLNSAVCGILPEYFIRYIALTLVDTMIHLWKSHKTAHRDIKPNNILIDTSGRIKLCDFGISSVDKTRMATKEAGCKLYMAPEKFSVDDKSYCEKTDVWSLGITLVELASGHYPYPAGRDSCQIMNNDPPKLSIDSFSRNLCNFIQQCLRKEPANRSSALELQRHPFIVTHNDPMFKQLAVEYAQKVLS